MRTESAVGLGSPNIAMKKKTAFTYVGFALHWFIAVGAVPDPA